ncbi:ribonuclease T2 family protein [Gloeothece verrucosa]|uniref:Ribonuclease T2 n=1 Tax=Gloeothece verrucosa (strain PCC 7822) TaxID=497965 RepID=E0UJR2_GLOV7|nr:ribonuclease T(2) [Gloeothece verrucosa]ADN13423.1 ribonuclease T2 [Gloeothece verrucosa PCC 7822]
MTLKKTFCLTAILCLLLTFWANSAWAIVEIKGTFTAQKTCQAVQSIKTRANPGNVQVSPQKSYPVVGKNQKDASYYLITIDDAKPPVRWVNIECGQLSRTPVVNSPSDYLLAISWQPSFCETKPKKPECIDRTDKNFEATNLALHGLWPQPSTNIYCNVSDRIKELDKQNRWSEMPPINLSPDTLTRLRVVMPGVASNLHLHEWYKHGTCYGTSPEQYFQDAMTLLTKINNSEVRNLLVANIGKDLNSSQIRNKFEQTFGNGAGDKVQIKCENDIDQQQQRMITELWVNLRGNIDRDPDLKSLLAKAPNVPLGCPSGEVDPIGINEKLWRNFR